MDNIQNDKRKPGAPKGRRPIIWVCSGVIDSKLVSEKYLVKDQKPESDNGLFPKDEAVAQYLEKYHINPEIVLGPFYDKKSAQTKKVTRKRGVICRDIASIRLKADQKAAIFDNWHGVANFLENDPDRALFVFLREVDPVPNKEKKAPSPGTVPISDLVFED